MRKGVLLRQLHPVMDDSYSTGELYAVFKDQAFRKSKMMDIVLLSETLRAMDDRPDEEAAPHKEQIWQQICNRIGEMRKPVALGLTRRAIAVLAIILVLLLTGVAVGMIDWSSVFRNTYHEEQQITRIEDWSLTRKRDILDALKAVAIPAVEVHLSDVGSRESFRQISYAGMACIRTFAGLGFEGYRQAILYLKNWLTKHA